MGFDMKEYLRKNSGGKYITEFASEQEASELHAADWIEIPEGADTLAGDKHIRYFWKHGNPNFIIGCGESLSRYPNWDKCDDSADEWVNNFEDDTAVIWKRESPNDKLASAEQYRQAEVLPFIDDEPKNVEQGSIEQTLAQRQSQYGCFEDVAFVTQGMIELMRKCNYDKMPASHQMALSMICSKMARIVNGDFNHKDSWHDIGGYARLIEDEIFDDITEMPF